MDNLAKIRQINGSTIWIRSLMYDSMTRHMTKDYRSMTLLVDVVETLNPWEKTQGNN